MKNDTQSEKETCRIAHAIVELVERTNGPMTLVQVEREIAGFAKYEPPSWIQPGAAGNCRSMPLAVTRARAPDSAEFVPHIRSP